MQKSNVRQLSKQSFFKRNSSKKLFAKALLTISALVLAIVLPGCASGALKVISAPAKPLAAYKTIAIQMTESLNVTYGGAVSEINKLKTELITKLSSSQRYDAIYDYATEGSKAEIMMDVKPMYLYTGMNKMTAFFYYGPPVVLEVTIFNIKTKQSIAKFEASGYETGIRFGGAMGMIQSAVATDASIVNAVDYINNYIAAN